MLVKVVIDRFTRVKREGADNAFKWTGQEIHYGRSTKTGKDGWVTIFRTQEQKDRGLELQSVQLDTEDTVGVYPAETE